MEGQEQKPSPRSDLWQALFWVAVGGAIFYGSWTMDRLENVGVKPFSAPGLLPGILGVLVVLLGAVMLVRALRAGALGPRATGTAPVIEWRRLFVPIALCLAYAGGLVGRGVPFWVASWLFVAAMIWTLQYRERREKRQLARLALVAAGIGLGAGVAVSVIFQEIFLIRLP
jgi:hypothetical protein